jgi:hypothetical protein
MRLFLKTCKRVGKKPGLSLGPRQGPQKTGQVLAWKMGACPRCNCGRARKKASAAGFEQDENQQQVFMVPGVGLEPTRLAAGDFESPASTYFTTRAGREKLLHRGCPVLAAAFRLWLQTLDRGCVPSPV